MNAEPLSQSPLGLLTLLSLAALLPFGFMTLTAFVKISTVLYIVRTALGAQNIPSGAVVIALSSALTLIAMAPVGNRIAERAAPLLSDPASFSTAESLSAAVEAVREPLRDFLSANASERERERFFQLARKTRPDPGAVGRKDLTVVIPAFVISELIVAFALGFALYLPFLVIDLVVANVLLALGMSTVNPVQLSLPFKLLLFVAIDGWGLLAQTLVAGYQPA